MKKDIKLYNVIFPVWFLMLFPQMWLIVLPGNFIIDSIVLVISMIFLKIEERKTFYKQSILKIFIIGLVSDVIGALFLFLLMIAGAMSMGDELYFTIPAMVISAFFIYFLNYKITFKKLELPLRKKMSLIFALVTAPYTFLIQSSWVYNF